MYIVGAVLIGGFAILGLAQMRQAETPYVTSIAKVETASGPVQFMGSVIPGKTAYNDTTNELTFRMKDNHDATLDVSFRGVKPANFDSAQQVVVRGNLVGKDFVADQVLCKCPSRYERK